MTQPHIYVLIIGVYGILDILVQKNKKSIVSLKSKDRTYLPIVLTFILTLIAVPVEYINLHKYSSWALMITGIGICAVATFIRTKSHFDLRHGFSTRIEIHEKQKLVTTGLYTMIRHPMYLAIILLLIGACIMLKALYSWIFVIINFITLQIRIKKEEEFLMANFPEYPNYMKKTYKLFPFLY